MDYLDVTIGKGVFGPCPPKYIHRMYHVNARNAGELRFETWCLLKTWCDNLSEVRETIISLLPLRQPDYHIYWILLMIYPRLERREKTVIDMIRGLQTSYRTILEQRVRIA